MPFLPPNQQHQSTEGTNLPIVLFKSYSSSDTVPQSEVLVINRITAAAPMKQIVFSAVEQVIVQEAG